MVDYVHVNWILYQILMKTYKPSHLLPPSLSILKVSEHIQLNEQGTGGYSEFPTVG